MRPFNESSANQRLPEQVQRIESLNPTANLYSSEHIEAAGYALIESPPPKEEIGPGVQMTVWEKSGDENLLLFLKSGDQYHYSAMIQKKLTQF